MPFYEDLSPYVYRPAQDDAVAVNVGWLASEHEFSRGVDPERLAGRLATLVVRDPVTA